MKSESKRKLEIIFAVYQKFDELNGMRGNKVSTHTSISKEKRNIVRGLECIKSSGKYIIRFVQVVRLTPVVVNRKGGLFLILEKLIKIGLKEGLSGIESRLITIKRELRECGRYAFEGSISSANEYARWIKLYDSFDSACQERLRAQIGKMSRQPKISIIMPVYDPPIEFLEQAIASVRSQIYQEWELCIADDASRNEAVRRAIIRHAQEDDRIKFVFRSHNGHIAVASNSALAIATGEFVTFLDNDDLLPTQALFFLADAILKNPEGCLFYSDEDKIDEKGRRISPYFKPAWNPDLFLSQNLICHLGAYKTTIVRELGGFREGFEGAQDYDLGLRVVEKLLPTQIVHIPRILYHWRILPGSTALAVNEKSYAVDAGRRALDSHFVRMNIDAKVEQLIGGMYRARYRPPKELPKVSIIIPTKNRGDLLRLCVESILTKTIYPNYEIIIIDNGSSENAALTYLEKLKTTPRIFVLHNAMPFNYSALNNSAASRANGEYLLLMNNDVEVISPDWLVEMVSLGAQVGVGAVGARLWFPDDTVQHAGCIGGIGGVAAHVHRNLPKGNPGYFSRADLLQTFSIVTAACLLVRKDLYLQVGGLDEINLKVAFNDVDFCLKLMDIGLRNVWTPYANLYHHESASRGGEDTPEKLARFSEEVLFMQKKWGRVLANDPAYNPNLSLEKDDFSLAFPPRLEIFT